MEHTAQRIETRRPHFAFLHHISLACRELDESKRFYVGVLGGELIHDVAGFSEVRIADITVGMSEQPSGWTERQAEHPPYGFNVDGGNFELAKAWIKQFNRPVHCLTGDYRTGLLDF